MKLTATQLQAAVIGCTAAEAAKFLGPINDTLGLYKIGDTPLRVAHFLAQIGHESGGFNAVREIASGAAYEGRKALGNTQPGDGVKFKGRGVIQITGRTNYTALGKAFGLDLLSNPALLETPEYAVKSAGWYWASRNINAIADLDTGAWGPNDKAVFVRITKAINGGVNGIADREARFIHARQALGFPAPLKAPPVPKAAPAKAIG